MKKQQNMINDNTVQPHRWRENYARVEGDCTGYTFVSDRRLYIDPHVLVIWDIRVPSKTTQYVSG